MKIVFDTNIILDAVARRADYESAQKLISLAASEEIQGVLTANSITDIYYISRKAIGSQNARKVVFDLLALFDIAPVDGSTCMAALNTPIEDFEDALLAVCAAEADADYIVTRDQDFIAVDSPVPIKSPGDVLALFKGK